MTTSVRLTQHTLPLSALSSEAAEECRSVAARSASGSASGPLSASSAHVVRFHYEVGVVEPKSGALHLIQVCCQVCVEGRGCCKASVCCDAVCCQLQLPPLPPPKPKGPHSDKAPANKFLADDEEGEKANGVSSHFIELPRTVAASAASCASLASYPITARELVAHVARCCDLCLNSQDGTCCKKDCCAVSCCLVNVEVVAAPVTAPAPSKSTKSDKPCSADATPVAPQSQVCGTSSGTSKCGGDNKSCCADKTTAAVDHAAAPPCASKCTSKGSKELELSACCTKDVADGKAKAPCAGRSSPSHVEHDQMATAYAKDKKKKEEKKSCCADKTGPAVKSPDDHTSSASKCAGKVEDKGSAANKYCCTKDVGAAGAKSDCGGQLPHEHGHEEACAGPKKQQQNDEVPDESPRQVDRASCSSASKCCTGKVDVRAALLAATTPSVKAPCSGGAKAKGCCDDAGPSTNKACGSKQDACASVTVNKSRGVQPVNVRQASNT